MYQQPPILLLSVSLLATYSTLDFTISPLAGKETWHLLPTTPAILPNTTKYFDEAA